MKKVVHISLILLPVLYLCFACSDERPDETIELTDSSISFTGRLLSADGSPLRGGRVNVYTSYAPNILRAEVDENGYFQHDIRYPDMYSVSFFGPNHKSQFIRFLFDSTGIQDITVQMEAVRLKEQPDRPKVLTAAADFDPDSLAWPMTRNQDGIFSARIPVDSDTLAFRISGFSDEEVPIVPRKAEHYLIQRGTTLFHGRASPFIAVIENITGPEMEVTFDPSDFYPDDTSFEVTFADPGSEAAVAYQLNMQYLDPIVQMYLSARQELEDGQSTSDIDLDLTEHKQAIIDEIAAAEGYRKDLLTVMYLGVLLPEHLRFEVKEEYLYHILNEIPPSAMIWSINTSWIRLIIDQASEKGFEEEAQAYYDAVYEQTSSRNLKVDILTNKIFEADREEDEGKIAEYLGLLLSNYPEHGSAERMKIRYSPDRAIQPGQPIPAFEVVSLDDPEIVYSQESLMGTTYLMDFWAVWCGPCIAEMPHLEEVYEKFRDRDFTILSLSFDRDPEDVHNFRGNDWAMPWKHTFIDDGFRSEMADSFEVMGIPKPILVDENGIIRAVDSKLRGESLLETIEEFFEAGGD